MVGSVFGIGIRYPFIDRSKYLVIWTNVKKKRCIDVRYNCYWKSTTCLCRIIFTASVFVLVYVRLLAFRLFVCWKYGISQCYFVASILFPGWYSFVISHGCELVTKRCLLWLLFFLNLLKQRDMVENMRRSEYDRQRGRITTGRVCNHPVWAVLGRFGRFSLQNSVVDLLLVASISEVF
jgi:hypothetical protein